MIKINKILKNNWEELSMIHNFSFEEISNFQNKIKFSNLLKNKNTDKNILLRVISEFSKNIIEEINIDTLDEIIHNIKEIVSDCNYFTKKKVLSNFNDTLSQNIPNI